MKRSHGAVGLVSAFFILSGFLFAQAKTASPLSPNPSLPAGVQQDWWSQVQSNIQNEEYHIAWREARDGWSAGYAAPNRAQGFRTWFTEEGIRVVPRTEGEPRWEWGLALVGEEAGSWKPEAGEKQKPGTHVSDNRIEFDRGWISEWYVNSPEGLEQGFTIPAPLPEVGSRKPEAGEAGVFELRTPNSELQLDMMLTGNLHPKFADDGQAVDFYDSGNISVLRYAKLKVTDAAGRVLLSRFEEWVGGASSQLLTARCRSGGGIRIAIDAEGAIYPITVDPLATSHAWSATGVQAGAYFGCSVSTAGDVNGDGYSDIIVGAINYDNGQSNEGRAYVFLGSPSGPGLAPAWKAEIDEADSRFGGNVATAGDVNGDGYSDIIVSAEFKTALPGGWGTGRVYAWYGSGTGLGADGTEVNADFKATGENGGDYFGSAIGPAGDVNGDGYGDILVAADAYTVLTSPVGAVYLYYGSSTGLAATGRWKATGKSTGPWIGSSVATAGDVNGDGYADILVGSCAWSGTPDPNGTVQVWHGNDTGPASGLTPDWYAKGSQANALFGTVVAPAGDVNGDGYSDILVGAPELTDGQGDEGAVFLWLGAAPGLGTADRAPDWKAFGDSVTARLGRAVGTAGDINGDGYADIVVGAPGYSNGQDNEGAALAWWGSASGLGADGSPANADWFVEFDQESTYFGESVATAGDINGDGYADVIVGASGLDQPFNDEGGAFVYLGSASGLADSAGWTGESNQANAYYGYSVAAAGDVNGDGYGDVVVGAHAYDNGETNEGRALLYLGGPAGLSTTADWMAESDQASAWFGCALGTAGDVNGDGYSDVVVGARGYGSYTGRAYLYLGDASGLKSTASWVAAGEGTNNYFGISVAAAGDVNGDGYSDVVVGAYGYSGSTGRAYVYYGAAAGLGSTAYWTATGEETGNYFGMSVATAGDVNGDGYSDVVVGAYKYNGSNGRAYVYHGGASGLGIAASWFATGEETGLYFGHQAAAADVNGDGFSDLIVGAPGSAYYYFGPGKVYLFPGGASGLGNTASWTASGEVMWEYFGYSVAAAGDVNGDGYADVVVGASGRDNSTGKAYLYLGGASGPDAAASWTAGGEATYHYFGASVAMAGDVNGDGYADVVVGAYGRDSNSGKAYLYFGNDGPGLGLVPQQRRADDAAPIDKHGKSDSETSFRLTSLGRTPFGRGKVKLEWEVKPLGTLFDGAGTQIGASWTDSGVTGAALNELASALTTNTNYHWRLRFLYNPAIALFQQSSRWFTQPWGGWQETDLRTAYPCAAPSALVNNSTSDLDGCADSGVAIAWGQDPGDWGDGGIGLRTYDVLRDGAPILTGIAYGTTSFTDTTGTDGQSYLYAVRYNNGCGLSAATAGASAADTITPPEAPLQYLKTDAPNLVFEWTPLVPTVGTYEVLRADNPQGPFDTSVGLVGGTSGMLEVSLALEPEEAYYELRADNGPCVGPF